MRTTSELRDLLRLWRNRADSMEASIVGQMIAAELRLCASELGSALKTLAAMPGEPEGVMHLALCESQALVLRPNVLYMFQVIPNCEKCKAIEADGALPTNPCKP